MKLQLLSDLQQRDQAPVRGGISLLSVNRPNNQRTNSVHTFNTPTSQVRKVIPVLHLVTNSPPSFAPQLIKQMPYDTDRAGNILYQSPSRNTSQGRINNNINHEDISFSQQNSGPNTADCTQIQSNNQYNSNYKQRDQNSATPKDTSIQMGNSPQKIVYQPQIQLLNPSIQLTSENTLLTSLSNLNSARLNQQQNFIKVVPVQKSIDGNFTNLRQVVSAFNTPIRKREDHLSIEKVQERINGGTNNKSQDILLGVDNERHKVFTDEFLESREKDLKRRIENLELQRNLLDDQLKYKEEQFERQTKEHQHCSQKIAQLEHALNQVQKEKHTNEKQLIEDVERLNLLVAQLYDQNVQLKQQLQQQNTKL